MKIYTVIEVNDQPVNITLKLPDNTNPILHLSRNDTLLALTSHKRIYNLKLHRGTKLKGRPILQLIGKVPQSEKPYLNKKASKTK